MLNRDALLLGCLHREDRTTCTEENLLGIATEDHLADGGPPPDTDDDHLRAGLSGDGHEVLGGCAALDEFLHLVFQTLLGKPLLDFFELFPVGDNVVYVFAPAALARVNDDQPSLSRACLRDGALIARIVKDAGAAIWELFSLVQTGRGATVAELTAQECEQVCYFLVDASATASSCGQLRHPSSGASSPNGHGRPAARHDLYRHLRGRLHEELGPPQSMLRAQTKGTRDGRGILFVGHDGDIAPSGFLPLRLGNVREDNIVRVYQDHPLLRRIRTANFSGLCGRCPWRQICGGS